MIQLESYGNPTINIAVFAIFVAATLGIVIAVTRQKSKASDFYTGGGAFSGRQNGLAITGDYLSAAAFLGVTGAIALYVRFANKRLDPISTALKAQLEGTAR